jgi:hypothetical protein
MINDDELLLYYYRDGLDTGERARIGAALAEQPELAQRLHKLVSRLDAAAVIPEVPVPSATLKRWQTALEHAASSQTARASRARHSFTPWYAAAAALLVAVIGVTVSIRNPTPQTAQNPAPSESPAEPATTSAYERGLKSHLASTEQQLASLESATPEERMRLIETIVEQNRIYALAAERANEPQLARVLRAFSPVLENLKKGEGNAEADVAQLAFEFRVMQGRLAAGSASSNQAKTL